VTGLARPSSSCTDKLQTRPLVREDAPQEENRRCLKILSMEVKRKWLQVLDGGLIQGQTGRLTVDRKISLTLELSQFQNSSHRGQVIILLKKAIGLYCKSLSILMD
jgi:hypothetical protein